MRERVIGAIVLIVIAAIMVPWLMSRAHHPREHLHDLALAAAPSASVPTALALAPATAGSGTVQRVRVAGAAQTARSAAASALARRPARTPVRQPAQRAAPPPRSAHAVAKQAASKSSARAPDRSRQNAPPQVSAAKAAARASEPSLGKGMLHQGDWFVQVASFASHANAAQLAILLTRAGYKAFLSPHTSGGTLLYRVRVGPYPSAMRARAVAPGLAAVSGSQVVVRQADGSGG